MYSGECHFKSECVAWPQRRVAYQSVFGRFNILVNVCSTSWCSDSNMLLDNLSGFTLKTSVPCFLDMCWVNSLFQAQVSPHLNMQFTAMKGLLNDHDPWKTWSVPNGFDSNALKLAQFNTFVTDSVDAKCRKKDIVVDIVHVVWSCDVWVASSNYLRNVWFVNLVIRCRQEQLYRKYTYLSVLTSKCINVMHICMFVGKYVANTLTYFTAVFKTPCSDVHNLKDSTTTSWLIWNAVMFIPIEYIQTVNYSQLLFKSIKILTNVFFET